MFSPIEACLEKVQRKALRRRGENVRDVPSPGRRASCISGSWKHSGTASCRHRHPAGEATTGPRRLTPLGGTRHAQHKQLSKRIE